MRKPLILANWKMNGSLSFIKDYFNNFSYSGNNEVGFCPPSVYLQECAGALPKNCLLGAQNYYFAENGAFTGEISPLMLADLGCDCVIIGHSERRELFSESGDLLTKKVQAAINAGLMPVFCIGESLAERESGKAFEALASQLQDTKDLEDLSRLVIAYEPIWAIGTGKTATAEIAQETHAFIRQWLVDVKGSSVAETTRILYGGSVKPENAKELFSQKDIDGGLVGGASLKPNDFEEICTAI